jgi:hypothetical protein
LALEALEGIHPGNMTPMAEEYWNKAITAIKQARSAPVQDSTCNETLRAQGKAYPRTCRKCGKGPCIALANAALDKMAENARELGLDYEPVAFEVGLVEWVGNKLMATPKVTTTPPASWMEMVTANLVRQGVNKHKARELAEHFYGLAQRQWVELTDEERTEIRREHYARTLPLMDAVEAKLKEKNNG